MKTKCIGIFFFSLAFLMVRPDALGSTLEGGEGSSASDDRVWFWNFQVLSGLYAEGDDQWRQSLERVVGPHVEPRQKRLVFLRDSLAHSKASPYSPLAKLGYIAAFAWNYSNWPVDDVAESQIAANLLTHYTESLFALSPTLSEKQVLWIQGLAQNDEMRRVFLNRHRDYLHGEIEKSEILLESQRRPLLDDALVLITKKDLSYPEEVALTRQLALIRQLQIADEDFLWELTQYLKQPHEISENIMPLREAQLLFGEMRERPKSRSQLSKRVKKELQAIPVENWPKKKKPEARAQRLLKLMANLNTEANSSLLPKKMRGYVQALRGLPYQFTHVTRAQFEKDLRKLLVNPSWFRTFYSYAPEIIAERIPKINIYEPIATQKSRMIAHFNIDWENSLFATAALLFFDGAVRHLPPEEVVSLTRALQPGLKSILRKALEKSPNSESSLGHLAITALAFLTHAAVSTAGHDVSPDSFPLWDAEMETLLSQIAEAGKMTPTSDAVWTRGSKGRTLRGRGAIQLLMVRSGDLSFANARVLLSILEEGTSYEAGFGKARAHLLSQFPEFQTEAVSYLKTADDGKLANTLNLFADLAQRGALEQNAVIELGRMVKSNPRVAWALRVIAPPLYTELRLREDAPLPPHNTIQQLHEFLKQDRIDAQSFTHLLAEIYYVSYLPESQQKKISEAVYLLLSGTQPVDQASRAYFMKHLTGYLNSLNPNDAASLEAARLSLHAVANAVSPHFVPEQNRLSRAEIDLPIKNSKVARNLLAKAVVRWTGAGERRHYNEGTHELYAGDELVRVAALNALRPFIGLKIAQQALGDAVGDPSPLVRSHAIFLAEEFEPNLHSQDFKNAATVFYSEAGEFLVDALPLNPPPLEKCDSITRAYLALGELIAKKKGKGGF